MTKLAYTEAAVRLASMVLDNREEEAKPRQVKPAAKKSRVDLALTRPAWVRGSLAEAVRREPVNDGWRGSGRARGCQFRGGWGGGGRGDSRGAAMTEACSLLAEVEEPAITGEAVAAKQELTGEAVEEEEEDRTEE